MPAEYLVWQPGFLPSFGTAIAACLAVGLAAALVGSQRGGVVLHRLAGATRRLECWSALGLLSSSCCLLQLALNAVSVGCAGFNTYLGPLRPQLIAVTASLQAWMWFALVARGRGQLRLALAASLLTSSLTFMPEVLHLWVHRNDGAAAAAGGAEVVQLSLEGMGCTACTVKVKQAVESLPGVEACAVDLEGATARVRLSAEGGALGGVVDAMIERLGASGFPARVSDGMRPQP